MRGPAGFALFWAGVAFSALIVTSKNHGVVDTGCVVLFLGLLAFGWWGVSDHAQAPSGPKEKSNKALIEQGCHPGECDGYCPGGSQDH